MDGPALRRLAAIVHADVVDYSRLMAADEDATLGALRALRGAVEGVVQQHRGRIMDFTGDQFLAEFASAIDAMSAVLALQRESAEQGRSLPEERRARLRIGVHAGEIREEDGRIFGDAIHVAARLQGIAEPGGICISATIRDELIGKLPLSVRDLGAQTLKNLGRPIAAFAVSLAPSDAEAPALVPGFAGRPAIAVLAFGPLGGDPDQEYLGEGIAEDLITQLATHRDFPVIARNSAFAYKGRSVDVKQIGRELGARYVIEGSVRRAGARVRVTAQLIDAGTGHHVWAERFDRDLADVFAIQDEIVAAVVARVYPEVMRAESERARQRREVDRDAWDLVVLARWYSNRYTRAETARAIELATRALELAPGLAEAVRVLQNARIRAGVNQWDELISTDPHALAEMARRALALSGESWQGRLVLGFALTLAGDFDEGLALLRRALELNPSSVDTLVTLANALARAGRGEEGLPLLQTAQRLDPSHGDQNFMVFTLSFVNYAMGRYAEAIEWGERATRLTGTHSGALRVLAASFARVGRLDEARAAVCKLVELSPQFRISELERILPAQPSLLAGFAEALRIAGAPE